VRGFSERLTTVYYFVVAIASMFARAASPTLPAHPINPIGRKAAEGLDKLGWHWWPGYNSIPSRAYGHLEQCERAGVCMYGCPYGAKASVDLALFPDAVKRGTQIVTGARVSEVTVNDKGLANGATYLKGGQQFFQPASIVIVAANGIGTPRLLLMSKSKQFPDGLANSSGLVGRRFMTHPFGTSVGIYDDEMGDVGPAGEAVESMEFYETDRSRGFVRGTKWHVMGTGGPIEMATRWQIGEGVRDEEFWGDQFAPRMKQEVGHSIDWIVHAEDLPEESNFVTLDPELTDADGLPAPKVQKPVTSATVTRPTDRSARS
jgi:choline dehydrogenase-like flavoprotein